MKHLLTTLLLAAAAASPAFAAEDHQPMHGGVVVETKAGDMELVAKSDLIFILLQRSVRSYHTFSPLPRLLGAV